MGLRVATGTYSGNNTDGRAITGLGFAPKMVYLRPDASGLGYAKFSSMPDNTSFYLTDNVDPDTVTDAIDSLDSDGFTVSDDGTTNSANRTGYTYYWWAIGGDTTDVVVSSYSGNGTDNRGITGIGFQPEMVWIKGNNNDFAVMKTSSMGDAVDLSSYFFDFESNSIQSLDSDGFTVGTSAKVNTSGVTYYYIAVKENTSFFTTGTYSGNATDNRDVTVGFAPSVVLITGDPGTGTYANAAFKTSDMAGDSALNLRLSTLTADWIQNLTGASSNGFQVGAANQTNQSGINFYWVAFLDNPTTTSVTPPQNTLLLMGVG